MIGSIVLTVLGLLVLLGVGHPATKDFSLPSLALVLVIAAIVGLNFIPPVTVGEFSFSFGTLLLVLSALFFWFFKGRLKNKLVCLLIIVSLSSALYAAVRICRYFSVPLWSDVNLYYGLIVGFFSFLATRNAKYGFIAGVLSVTVVSLITSKNIDLLYTPAVLAGTLAATLYASVNALMPRRPSKVAYYFETGRMLD